MPRTPRPLRDGSLDSLAGALGITRVARLTGLDVTGVEVASAVRPGGHVLQVTNGKGARFEHAARGALSEAAELWGAEHPVVSAFGAARALPRSAGPEGLEGAAPGAEEAPIAWAPAAELGSGRPALVPAHAVYCPPPGAALPGPAVVRWTSNGMGAHPRLEGAVLHGLLELVERDALARALPEGFTERELRARALDRAGWPAEVVGLAARVEASGLRVVLVDLSDGSVAGLPCAAALVVDPSAGAVPLAAGYACRLTPGAALRAALLEAAQSRATEIHGAREDVLGAERPGAGAIDLLARLRPRRAVGGMPRLAARSEAKAAGLITRRVAAATGRPVVVSPLPAPEGLHVVKVLAPGLSRSELL